MRSTTRQSREAPACARTSARGLRGRDRAGPRAGSPNRYRRASCWSTCSSPPGSCCFPIPALVLGARGLLQAPRLQRRRARRPGVLHRAGHPARAAPAAGVRAVGGDPGLDASARLITRRRAARAGLRLLRPRRAAGAADRAQLRPPRPATSASTSEPCSAVSQ